MLRLLKTACSQIVNKFLTHLTYFVLRQFENFAKLCRILNILLDNMLPIGHASVIVKDLNWLSLAYNFRENDTDANNFDWRSQEIDELKHVTILLAADGT